MKTFVALIFLTAYAISQNAYQIPFASKENAIELTVANTSSVVASNVVVEATSVPGWIKFERNSVSIDQLKANEEKAANFSFAIDKLALVNREYSITFTIKSKSGEQWEKEIKIQVSPPDRFELFQNYPNPFNPTTTICYQLAADSKVSLKLYDLLGRDVATLVDNDKSAGYHQEVFSAGRMSSGVYIYRVIYTDKSGKLASAHKTMMLLK